MSENEVWVALVDAVAYDTDLGMYVLLDSDHNPVALLTPAGLERLAAQADGLKNNQTLLDRETSTTLN